MSLTSSRRRSTAPVEPAAAWRVVASGEDRGQWYVDAAPFVFRAGVDRLVGGTGADAPPPGRPLLAAGDDAGFWTVTAADAPSTTTGGTAPGRLELVARVRAPGRVTLTVEVTAGPRPGTSAVTTTVHLAPRGVVGAAYLLADLPARETLTALVHRRLLRDVRAARA